MKGPDSTVKDARTENTEVSTHGGQQNISSSEEFVPKTQCRGFFRVSGSNIQGNVWNGQSGRAIRSPWAQTQCFLSVCLIILQSDVPIWPFWERRGNPVCGRDWRKGSQLRIKNFEPEYNVASPSSSKLISKCVHPERQREIRRVSTVPRRFLICLDQKSSKTIRPQKGSNKLKQSWTRVVWAIQQTKSLLCPCF